MPALVEVDDFAVDLASARDRPAAKGNVLFFANVGRRLNNDEFVGRLANAWAGTTTLQSQFWKGLFEPPCTLGNR